MANDRTSETHGEEFYSEIGHKGSQRVRKLIEEGKSEETHGKMTVEEAGRMGGLRTCETHGEEFYSEIGRRGGRIGGPKGGQRVRKLIEEGKAHEEDDY